MRVEIDKNCKSVIETLETTAAKGFSWTPPADPITVTSLFMENFNRDGTRGYAEIELSNGDMLVFNLKEADNEEGYEFELCCNLEIMTEDLDYVMDGYDSLVEGILNTYIKYRQVLYESGQLKFKLCKALPFDRKII